MNIHAHGYFISFIADIQATSATAYYQNGQIVYKPNVLDVANGVAYASFKDGLLGNGWGVLDVVSGYTSQKIDDRQTMYAAGFLEGALTFRLVSQERTTTRSLCEPKLPSTNFNCCGIALP